MDEAGATRKLAAILVADAAGFSRLMGEDEAATVQALNASRALFREHVRAHGGRLVDTAGDSVLSEFPSAVDAVACAVEIQEALTERNACLSEHRRMQFRIGVNVGDVIVQDDGTLYGDGVNVAARIQALAEPGGIALSEDAQRLVAGKLDVDFIYAGEHAVKNIPRPVRIWRVPIAGQGAVVPNARPVFGLPFKPSIAVLPFNNMSGDPEQEFVADGLAEDLITALSRIHWLFVSARNSSFTFKGTAVSVGEVARVLGVRYVVEGSVRKAGNRIRVTAQLIDAETGNHVWATRYDREIADIFVIQDEISEAFAAAIEPEIGQVERERARRKAPDSLDCWEHYQRGLWHLYSSPPQTTPRPSACCNTRSSSTPASARLMPASDTPIFSTRSWVSAASPIAVYKTPIARSAKPSPSTIATRSPITPSGASTCCWAIRSSRAPNPSVQSSSTQAWPWHISVSATH